MTDDETNRPPKGVRRFVTVSVERAPVRSVSVAFVVGLVLVVGLVGLVSLLFGIPPESVPVLGGVVAFLLGLLEFAVGVAMVVGYVIVAVVGLGLIYGVRTGSVDDWFPEPTRSAPSSDDRRGPRAVLSNVPWSELSDAVGRRVTPTAANRDARGGDATGDEQQSAGGDTEGDSRPDDRERMPSNDPRR
ncbi:MAG: hypothetical protein ABEJ73_06190 [Haloplanus sp.]